MGRGRGSPWILMVAGMCCGLLGVFMHILQPPDAVCTQGAPVDVALGSIPCPVVRGRRAGVVSNSVLSGRGNFSSAYLVAPSRSDIASTSDSSGDKVELHDSFGQSSLFVFELLHSAPVVSVVVEERLVGLHNEALHFNNPVVVQVQMALNSIGVDLETRDLGTMRVSVKLVTVGSFRCWPRVSVPQKLPTMLALPFENACQRATSSTTPTHGAPRVRPVRPPV